MSKRLFHWFYGSSQGVSRGYFRYFDTIRRVIQYWGEFHMPQQTRVPVQRCRGMAKKFIQKPPTRKPEAGNPADSLKEFVRTVGKSLGESGVREGFEEVEALLLEAAEIPTEPPPLIPYNFIP